LPGAGSVVGWGFGISSSTANVSIATEIIRYLTSPSLQVILFQEFLYIKLKTLIPNKQTTTTNNNKQPKTTTNNNNPKKKRLQGQIP